MNSTIAFEAFQKNQNLLGLVSQISYIIIGIIFTIALFSLVSEKKKQDIALGKRRLKEVNLKSKFKHIQKFKETLYVYLDQKGQIHMINNYLWGGVILIAGSSIYLLAMKQVLLALLFPIILFNFFIYITTISIKHITEDIELQLPTAIDHMIRVSTKSDSLKTIFYESSRRLEEPLRGIFEQTALKMTNTDPEAVLLQIGNEYNNIWIYSFTFILISYTKQDNKEEVISNLRNLRNMLENENQQKKIQKTERKYAIIMNYIISICGVIGWFLNLALNPVAKDFFFGSLMGLACLLIGMGSIFATIIINIRLGKYSKN